MRALTYAYVKITLHSEAAARNEQNVLPRAAGRLPTRTRLLFVATLCLWANGPMLVLNLTGKLKHFKPTTMSALYAVQLQ